MKNEAIPPDGSPSDAWTDALRRFDRELHRRGAAEHTRRAYGADAGELAAWAAAAGLGPADIGYPALRRWAAASRAAVAAATSGAQAGVPRASSGRWSSTATCAPTGRPAGRPEVPQRLPRRLKPDDGRRAARRIPATTPLELRDRRIFEVAYALRAARGGARNLDRVGRLRRGAAR
jgi:integrase/recombinase XerC/integrase/recombinase XerD